ncbi:hypothetical protein AN478_01425 [Thiohalorhabdus denitrificans]|uniref:DUF4382 domain-containing protein n=1 Tax=Thiohalorhabdus denitrificans TaxID=381306 RepID=A0A0P9CQY5_9GAMM|nr:DUF4382 domain-containing protein [Thiohalorhabdus denitrificans]KPV41752.1 hypothetical protein AN478_01425 [Thiohalorhabdus denitrificans]SCY53325.1 protein of unknown function [Thiohalorhabdus denitrificans]
MQAKTGLPTLGACAGAVLLAACAGESGGGGSDTGSVTVAVTDAPVDAAEEVVVTFDGVTLKPADGPPVEHTFEEARSVDLLTLTGSAREKLLDGVTVPAGPYNWMRLHVEAEQGVSDSYIRMDGSEHSLYVPSGAETGLKLVRGFTVPAGGEADFTVDFDLRKSVHQPQDGGDYYLRPALRLVDNATTGHLAGTVTANYVTDSCESPDNGLAVYVYEGSGVTPDDVDGTEPDPVTSAMAVQEEDTGDYRYEAGYLAAGTYTVAFTCNARDDDPEADDDTDLLDPADVEITEGETATHDFTL